MKRIAHYLRELLRCESGATSTEYAVMIALVLLVVIGAVAALGEKVSSSFNAAEQGF